MTEPRIPRRITWALGWALAAVGSVAAAASAPAVVGAPPGANVRFQRLTIDDGLAQSSINAVIQDRQGYIWMGTEDGLHRYDGYSFTIFRHDAAVPTSISENHIYALLEDRDGGVWAGTYNGGLDRYDPQTGEFTRFPSVADDPTTLSDPTVYTLTEDRTGRIWAGTDDGLDRIDRSTGKVTRYLTGKPATKGLRHNRIWALHTDLVGRVWIGTHAGLSIYDPATDRFAALNAPAGWHVQLNKSVNAITSDASGRVWVGTELGIVVFDRDLHAVAEYWSKSSKPEPPAADRRSAPPVAEVGEASLPDPHVRALLASASGEIWVGTSAGGLLQLNPVTGAVQQFRHDPADVRSLSDDSVVSLLEDRGGVLWVGTESQGANRFNPATRRFQHWRSEPGNPDSLPNRMVWSILEARDGAVWVGTDHGLARIDRATGVHRIYGSNKDDPHALQGWYVPALFQDQAGTIWVGTSFGLHRLRADGGFDRIHFKGTDPDDDSYLNGIVAFAQGAAGHLWVGTSAGLVDYDPKTGDWRRLRAQPDDPHSLASDYVLALFVAHDGSLWVGSEGGLSRYDARTDNFTNWRHEEGKPSLAHNSVQAIAEDGDGNIWLGLTVGLDRLDPASGAFEHLTTAQGLPNDTVYGLIRADDGGLWMSTNRGIARLDLKTHAVRSWLVEDGLQSNEFNGGAYARGQGGWLYFGGINGLNAFRPSDLVDRDYPPSLAITEVDLGNRHLQMVGDLARDQHLTLDYTEPVLTLQFAVFDYAAPNKNRFSFRLEGFDPDWRDGGTRNHVTYTNLDPGDYVFEVKGANTHGVWSTEAAKLSITVLPPPWRTWWAYALYVLATLTIIVAVFRAHHLRVTREHQLEAEQQKRRWSETLHQLSQSLASSLDAQQIAELLMDSLRRMLPFRSAALFVEQGVEVALVGARGMTEEQVRALRMLPDDRARLFAEVRHRREPTIIEGAEISDSPLGGDGNEGMRYLAIPTFSRSEEFALLLVGRADAPFTDQEREIAAAVARQALVALDNARLFAELQNLATTDNLTKVNNRRYFFELAELEFARSRRYGRNLSVILLDADEFTAINEQYGHEVGDRVLRLIASTCRANLRHFDIIGRYGGEDFVILLPETALNIAADVADRLRKAIEGLMIETHKGELRVTVSLGVAIADAEVTDLATLINRADMALYEAKRSGRNRVVVAEQH